MWFVVMAPMVLFRITTFSDDVASTAYNPHDELLVFCENAMEPFPVDAPIVFPDVVPMLAARDPATSMPVQVEF